MSVCVEGVAWLCGVCVYRWGHFVFRERREYRCGGRDGVCVGVCVESWMCGSFKGGTGVFVWRERLLSVCVCIGRRDRKSTRLNSSH